MTAAGGKPLKGTRLRGLNAAAAGERSRPSMEDSAAALATEEVNGGEEVDTVATEAAAALDAASEALAAAETAAMCSFFNSSCKS